jgi:hypothetical protein
MRQIFRTFQSGRAYRPPSQQGGGGGPDYAMTLVFIMGIYFATKSK